MAAAVDRASPALPTAEQPVDANLYAVCEVVPASEAAPAGTPGLIG